MLIDNIVHFCDTQYRENKCENCVQKSKCNNDCFSCLNDIHWHENKIRTDYDCVHLLDYYVCRYSHKYCSEIIYALEMLDFSEYPYFNILSLGCGGAPDLMAFDYKNYNKDITYIGYDKNIHWEKVHNEIINQFTNGQARFNRGTNVLDFFIDHTTSNFNIVVIEYLISCFYRQVGEQGLIKWFDQLANQIIQNKPGDSPLLIIINDVDSINTGRDSIPLLRSAIENLGFNVSIEYKMQFKPQKFYKGSERYPSQANKFQIPDGIRDRYHVAITCESVQLILEVN
ncbi:MAG: hypothetical protein H0S79_09875 [Anaerolineaceae bacterium]|nr:hypothetical protein [Anaerolineaceae bacterium]